MMTSQQNSIYGQQQQPQQKPTPRQSSHLLDLANLQTSAFEQQQQQQQLVSSIYLADHSTSGQQPQQAKRKFKNNNTSNKNSNSTDMSLYSPSSSTSLLYHIYDQINVPSSDQMQSQPQQPTRVPKSSTTTILHPANLFGASNSNQNPTYLHQTYDTTQLPFHNNDTYIAHSNDMAAARQQQMMLDSMFQRQHQTIARSQPTHNNNVRPLSSSGVSSLSNQSSQSNAMLAYGRQPRQQQQQQQQQKYQQINPLIHSSSNGLFAAPQAASTLNPLGLMSNRMMEPTMTTPTPPTSDQSTCYLQHPFNSRTMQPHQQSLTNLSNKQRNNAYKDTIHPSTLWTPRSPTTGTTTTTPSVANVASVDAAAGNGGASRGWKQVPQLGDWQKVFANVSTSNKRAARTLIVEYQSVLRWSILLILLALSLVSILKFISSPQQQTSNTLAATTASINQVQSQLNYAPFKPEVALTTNGNAQQQRNEMVNVAQHQSSSSSFNTQTGFAELHTSSATQTGSANGFSSSSNVVVNANTQQPVDVLTSRLLIGEFVIVSQNYSQSQAQRSLLTERIVKLLDQVFLASDVRRFYARTEVTNMRPNLATGNGIVVDCNIVLTDSIAYAAQQFGIALYDALAKSSGRLANQVGYVIDKNTIRFNTVPDKDLRAGLVPLTMIAPSVRRELELSSVDVSSSSSSSIATPVVPSIDLSQEPGMDNIGAQVQDSQMNSVVWSEWSLWSSCIDKNGVCDPMRLHSRLRKCVAQHTGDKVDVSLCKKRFNAHDLELEVTDCAATCRSQPQQMLAGSGLQNSMQQQPSGDQSVLPAHTSAIMSDAPVMMAATSGASNELGSSPQTPVVGPQLTALFGAMQAQQQHQQQQQQSQPSMAAMSGHDSDLYTPSSVVSATHSPAADPSGSTLASSAAAAAQQDIAGSRTAADNRDAGSAAQASVNLQQQQQLTCSNCTSGEICLLLMTQKVPFCAKIKDRADECGGWCKAQSQLCQSMGANAFKCIHDSECLEGEWRCHDSACIPQSKRCDGHSNCYDSSDERDCPIGGAPVATSGGSPVGGSSVVQQVSGVVAAASSSAASAATSA